MRKRRREGGEEVDEDWRMRMRRGVGGDKEN